jgi:hypothetical protein
MRACRRALIAASPNPLRTRDLLRWAFPGRKREFWHYKSAYRAAPRYAVKIGRKVDQTGAAAPHSYVSRPLTNRARPTRNLGALTLYGKPLEIGIGKSQTNQAFSLNEIGIPKTFDCCIGLC